MKLHKEDEKLIVERPWATLPFKQTESISVPVYDFQSGKFNNKLANLDPKHFNLPLRRDLVHRVHQYFLNLHKKTFKRAKTRGDTAGSGIKMRP